MVLIFRIECDQFGGMYHGPQSGSNPLTFKYTDRHPSPAQDSALIDGINERIRQHFADCDIHEMDIPRWFEFINQQRYFFGFSTKEQLRNWVYQDDWMKELDNAGLQLSVYEVEPDDAIIGHTQALFIRDRAKQTYRTTLCEFFEIK